MAAFMKFCCSLLVPPLKFAVMLTTGTLVLDVLWGVISRYILGYQSSWTEELARVLLIWSSLLGAALTFYLKGHLGVDYLVSKFDASSRRILGVANYLIICIFAGYVLIYGGIGLVKETFALEQRMMALGIAKGFVYLVVPLCGIFIIVFSLSHLVEEITGKTVPAQEVQLD